MPPFPLAYLITFTCYGTRLHGDEDGSVDRRHNIPGAPFVPPDRGWVMEDQSKMKRETYQMDRGRRNTVLGALRQHCSHRGWKLLAAHVRSSHVHLVVAAEQPPERILTEVKGYASRALRRRERGALQKRWTRHGSTRYLWKIKDVAAAIEYVVHQQGEPMAVWHEQSEPRPQGSGGD